MWSIVHFVAIGVQIATLDNLKDKEALGFSNDDSEDAMTYRNLGEIQIPTTVIMNQIAIEGKI